MSREVQVRFRESIRVQFPGATRLIVMVQDKDEAQFMEEALRKRFAAYGLELHPAKTRVISFGRYEDENARRQGRKPNAFDFLGFEHLYKDCGDNVGKGRYAAGAYSNLQRPGGIGKTEANGRMTV